MTAAHRNAPSPPTPGEQYRPGCTGKVRQTRQQALRAAARRGCGEAYRCGVCGKWHTATTSQKLPS